MKSAVRTVLTAISQSQEHRVIDGWVSGIDRDIRLKRVATIGSGLRQRCERGVQLRHPHGERRIWSCGRRDIRIVGSNSLTGRVPFEKDLLARERQRLRSIAGDGSIAVKASHVAVSAILTSRQGRIGWRTNRASDGLVRCCLIWMKAVDVGIVDDMERGEILPGQSRCPSWTRYDIRCEIGPRPLRARSQH